MVLYECVYSKGPSLVCVTFRFFGIPTMMLHHTEIEATKRDGEIWAWPIAQSRLLCASKMSLLWCLEHWFPLSGSRVDLWPKLGKVQSTRAYPIKAWQWKNEALKGDKDLIVSLVHWSHNILVIISWGLSSSSSVPPVDWAALRMHLLTGPCV